ncbi:hypothetical protein MMC07_007872 [Pseudocyphellaria aurata]|nr:hypothetical protein [Pseudocyphellaria aurata]
MNMNSCYNLPRILHEQAANLRRYVPPFPGATPSDLFHDAINSCTAQGWRFIRKTTKREMLMYIDGSCLGNGTPNARAGYGVRYGKKAHLSMRLEGTGPETSNRAELRAAIVALGLRVWNGEGFDKVILACDSEYVVLGICERVQRWKQRNWKTSAGTPVVNKDLWEALLAKLETLDDRGVMVQFWQIPRELNEADSLAVEGANKENRDTEMTQIFAVELPAQSD